MLSGRARTFIVVVLLICGIGTAFVLTLKKGSPALPKVACKPSATSLSPMATSRPLDAPLAEGQFNSLEPGLDFGTFVARSQAGYGDSKIGILRVDPSKFQFVLLNASASTQGRPQTARQWCRQSGYVAAINASMYRRDNRTSVGYMRTIGHVNNSKLTGDKAVLAFDPHPGNPFGHIADLDRERFVDLKRKYRTLIQSIRMVSADGKNVWARSDKRCSTAAIGEDRQGRMLFIHVRTPYTTHDLTDILLKLPIDLKRAMYVEGGPEAQLYVNAGRREFELIGDYVASQPAAASNRLAWPIPNVIGIARK